MSSPDSSWTPEQTLLMARLISYLLLGGELIAAAAVFYLSSSGFHVPALRDPGIGWLDFTAAGFGVLSIVLALILRKVFWATAEGRDRARAMTAFLRGTIVYMVLLEAACLFSLVCWLITARAVPNAIMALVLFLIGLVCVPRKTL